MIYHGILILNIYLEMLLNGFVLSIQLKHAGVNDCDTNVTFLFNFTFRIGSMHVLFGILVLLNFSLKNLNVFRKDS
jgi:NADH:ubiquinone oxidoreductase subunit K